MPQNPNDPLSNPRIRVDPEAEQPVGDHVAPDDAFGWLVELAGGHGMSPVAALDTARQLEPLGFTLDEESEVTPLGEAPERQTYVVTGRIANEAAIVELERDPRVVRVWRPTPIAPF